MDKKSLTEAEIRTRFITPAIQRAWRNPEQIWEEKSFTKWKITVRGKTVKRWEVKRVDYLLSYKKNFPIAIVEAKDNKHEMWDWMQQAQEYAEMLQVPFVFTSNWDWFVFHDDSTWQETELTLEQFPSPEILYKKWLEYKWITPEQEKIVSYDYYDDWSWKEPRYYQRIAINKTVEAISKWQNRILLVMATWTWKTYTAFQIIWRLWKSWAKKRILFLADRNILVDQAMTNDFKPFGWKMTKVTHKQIDKSYEVYLALYQGLTWEIDDCYTQFSKDFFDLIIIDECHRWSAKEDSNWRAILDYFSSATHIWLTATPKETSDVSNQTYFWEPVYTYSLKQWIEDWYLAPYKVIKVLLNVDDWWRPYKWQLDFNWEEIPDKEYNSNDYDRLIAFNEWWEEVVYKKLIIKERTEEVAKRITEYLKSTDRMAKTIVFCVDIDHAERMRKALVNENADMIKQNKRYVMKITWDDLVWKQQLDNFIDPKEPYPVIVTTSKLLTTWVDAQTCKVVVLDTVINSITEFKQIIWRWSRINEDYWKQYFTIIDFRKATRLFADPKFDWIPEIVYEPKPDQPMDNPDDVDDTPTEDDPWDFGDDWTWENEPIPWTPTGWTIPTGWDDNPKPQIQKIIVNWVRVKVANERVQYLWVDWKLITESVRDYSKKSLLSQYESFDKFLEEWKASDKKKEIVDALKEKWVFFEDIEKQLWWQDMDPFDIICYIAFDKPALTRKERAQKIQKETLFSKYWEKAREVIEMLIQKYTDQWIEAIEDIDVLKVSPLSNLWTPREIVLDIFWSRQKYDEMIRELEKNIYEMEY